MQILRTFRDRASSIWQSAAEEAAAQVSGMTLSAARIDPLTMTATALASAMEDDESFGQAPTLIARKLGLPESALSMVSPLIHSGWRCATLAARLAWAVRHNDSHAVAELQDELKFSTCDPRWVKTAEIFLRYFALNK